MHKITIFLALLVVIATTYAAPADDNVAVEVTDPTVVTVVADGADVAKVTTVNPNSSSDESKNSGSSSEEKKKATA